MELHGRYQDGIGIGDMALSRCMELSASYCRNMGVINELCIAEIVVSRDIPGQ